MSTPHLTIAELEEQIKRVEPAAFLVPPRLLRRVIKHHRNIGGIGLLVPHRKGYVIARDDLLRAVRPVELGVAPNTELPAYVFLMVRPERERLARLTRDQAIEKHHRIFFHLHIDHAMQQKLANGSLTPNMVRQRVQRLGLTEFAEITDVLRQEDYLLPPDSLESVYAEFVAVYLTLRRFDPARASHVFPALRDLAAVDALVAEDIDADAIYHATRLTNREGERQGSGVRSQESGVRNQESGIVSPDSCFLTPDSCHLTDRLKTALELSDADAENWRQALGPLLAKSGDGWSQETRLKYDLQSLCLDSEHGIYAVDIAGWALSLGELPIKRRLPGHEEVAILRNLRRALDRTRLVHLAETDRQRLTHLLTEAIEQRERRLRERFRPVIASALDEVGLKPANTAEEVGRAKLTEELLDRVVENGHFNIGNLRDAISRNQMKLPDLSGPSELVRGDPLIQLNRKLAVSLDGVYRRGEFYMRLLHRLSSVAFGTPFGRLLVLYLILPFGLAFFVMITPGIAIEEAERLTQLVGLSAKTPAPDEEWDDEWEEPVPRPASHLPLPSPWGVAGFGVFFLLLFHVRGFRRRIVYGLGTLGRGLKAVFIHGPIWLVRSPALQAILHNWLWRMIRRYVIWPTLMAVNGGLIAWLWGLETPIAVAIAGGCLALGVVLFNTRLGRDAEESATDLVLRFWVWFSIDFVPGLLHLFMDVSRRCLDAVEQMLYTVSEWLRFRGGENRALVVAKAILGLFWYCVTYFIRFAINLLIEPQINPIKHFPVVTVSHKVCLPLIPTLASVLKNTLDVQRPTTAATGIIFGIPGIFGFMVWELKENWKLYAANRAADLKPVLIGSHGETMLRLLHPGFHSGTLPKLYKRLRRAERRGQADTVRKIMAQLHHVEESIAHFVERELLTLLRRNGLSIELGPIRLATNRVAVELRCRALAEEPLVCAFDHQAGWLLAGVLEPGWLPRLNAEQRTKLAAGLAGLYKMAGVDLTREQIAASVPGAVAFVVIDDRLVIWTDSTHDVAYDLNAGPELPPIRHGGAAVVGMPVLDAAQLLFSNDPLSWDDWVRGCAGDVSPVPHGLLPATKA